jgi:hypothetical protein
VLHIAITTKLTRPCGGFFAPAGLMGIARNWLHGGYMARNAKSRKQKRPLEKVA